MPVVSPPDPPAGVFDRLGKRLARTRQVRSTAAPVSSGADGGDRGGFEGLHLSFHSEPKLDWDGARRACRAIGGELASLHSRHEHNLALERLEIAGSSVSRAVWVGLNMRRVRGRWEWTDGSHLDFVAFDRANGPPGGQGAHGECAGLWVHGKWHVHPCSETMPYLCRYQSILAPEASEPLQNRSRRPTDVPSIAVRSEADWEDEGWSFHERIMHYLPWLSLLTFILLLNALSVVIYVSCVNCLGCPLYR